MYVESLALENYRNYAHLSVNLSPGINIFFGDNAQGKTNVLEALYMCDRVLFVERANELRYLARLST